MCRSATNSIEVQSKNSCAVFARTFRRCAPEWGFVSMKYAAFISYRHGGIDERIATGLQKEIEKYRLPPKIAKRVGKHTLGKVFRDADDLRAASNLSAIIKEGLDESEYLIVVCTRRYQESPWCMEEIEYFMKIRGRDNIIVVLAEGEPEESFPKILTETTVNGKTVHIEPLAVDVRADSDREVLKLVSREKLRFISQMLDMDYDDLRQRQRERRKRQAILVSLAAFSGLSIFIGTILYKNFQLNVAYGRLDSSMQQTLKGQSYYLSEYAAEAFANGDRTTAALLALEALPENLKKPDRPYVPSVMNALTSALGVYDYSNGYQADEVFRFEEESYDAKVELSSDRKILLVEKYQSAAGNMLHGTVYLYFLESKAQIAQYELADIPKTSSHSLSRCARLLKDNKTLLYLAEDGVRAVDIYSGKESYSGKKGYQMVLSEKEDIFAVYNSKEGMIYYYDSSGTKIADTDVGTDRKYNLYCISPDSSIAVLSQDAKKNTGILLTDTHSGAALFADKVESCSRIQFIDDHSLCFVRQDSQIGRSHIVVYDLNKNTDDYLVDTDRNIGDVAISGYGTCFFYSGQDVYEISEKTGKIRWQNAFSADVESIEAAGDYLAVTLADGQSYFYHSRKKELINIVTGNGEPFYMLALGEDYACLQDYWGQNIRIYRHSEKTGKNVLAKDFSSVSDAVPDAWYTAASGGDTFLLDLKNGISDRVLTFSTENLKLLSSTTLRDMDYESFSNLSVDAAKDYVGTIDYAYGENAHFDSRTMKKVFTFDEDSYYFYNDDRTEITVAEEGKLVTYRARDGKKQKEIPIRSGYDRGVCVGGCQIFGNDSSILVEKDGKVVKQLRDAVIYSFSEKKSLLFYRNVSGTKWYAYSLEEKKNVCSGDAGVYSCTMLFDDSNYFLNDYNAVYDTKTWKKVLDLSEISTGVYGVSTTDDLPYFVVWYQSGNIRSSGKSAGTNTAYLYSKEYEGEIVGVIPNYVTTAKDGQIVVYDGDHSLYKFPLYKDTEIVRLARDYVKKIDFTEEQKQEYHIYGE